MIRLIQRRLIIPRGDTGSFTVPTLTTVSAGDVAVFSIFDRITNKNIFEKMIELSGGEQQLTIDFTRDDTINLNPGKYYWDITLYNEPDFEEDENGQKQRAIKYLKDGNQINSYYAAFRLPICEIKEVAEGVPREMADTGPVT